MGGADQHLPDFIEATSARWHCSSKRHFELPSFMSRRCSSSMVKCWPRARAQCVEWQAPCRPRMRPAGARDERAQLFVVAVKGLSQLEFGFVHSVIGPRVVPGCLSRSFVAAEASYAELLQCAAGELQLLLAAVPARFPLRFQQGALSVRAAGGHGPGTLISVSK